MAKNSTPTTNEVKMKNLKRQVFIAVAIAAIVVSFSTVFMKFLFDLWTYNGRVQSAQRETKTTLEDNIDTYEGLTDWYRVLEEADGTEEDPDPEIVLDALPEKYDFPALATSVNKLADISDVELLEFVGTDEEGSVPEPSHQPEPYEIEFAVEVNASYENISEFVNALDLSIRPFEVTEIDLRGSDESLRAEISLKTYFQPRQNLDYPERTIR